MIKYFKFVITLTSLLLCVSIAVTFPAQVLAESLPNKSETQIKDHFDSESENKPYTVGNIICEDVKQNAMSILKQFRLDDGSYMAVNYEAPIHYQDENGKWIDYDNTLISGEITNATSDEANTDEYTNKKSNIDVKYSKKSKENNMVKIKKDDYMVSWGYKNTNKVKATIVSNDEQLDDNDKYTALKNLTSEVYMRMFMTMSTFNTLQLPSVLRKILSSKAATPKTNLRFNIKLIH